MYVYIYVYYIYNSVQFSHSVMSDSLWPCGPHHARLPCPSPTPGAYSSTGECWVFKESSQFSSVQFSCSVLSNSLRPHESKHARPPCPSPTPRVHANSCPLSRWCHPAISSSVVPLSSCPQHQGLFQWVNSLHEVAKVLEFQLQHQPFQWIFRTDFL